MALVTNELYSESTRGPLPAIQPADGPGSVVVRTFTSASDVLPVGTPVCLVPTTGHLDICDPDQVSTNLHELEIFGIVYPAAITRSGSGEVLGTVMLKGSIDFSVIKALQTQLTGSDQNLIDLVRNPNVRLRGLFIDGITRSGGNAGLANP